MNHYIVFLSLSSLKTEKPEKETGIMSFTTLFFSNSSFNHLSYYC